MQDVLTLLEFMVHVRPFTPVGHLRMENASTLNMVDAGETETDSHLNENVSLHAHLNELLKCNRNLHILI